MRWFCIYDLGAQLFLRKIWCYFQFHLSSKALPASFNGGKTFSLDSAFLNCFHMSAPGIKITGRLKIGVISSHSSRIPVVKFSRSIFTALNIHIDTEKIMPN